MVKCGDQSDILKNVQLPVDAKWELQRNWVDLNEKLDEGFFGQVWRGSVLGVYGPGTITPCAVKMLKSQPNAKDVSDLFAEIQTLKEVCNPPHKNIINLVGICTSSPGPIFVVLEYAELGNLRDFLRKYRKPGVVEHELTHSNLVDFGGQVCKGMDYLHSRNVVHRDLASRNVLVKHDNGMYVMKIAQRAKIDPFRK